MYSPRKGKMMKENMLDVLMYLFENYMDEGPEFSPDQETLATELYQAGFPRGEINKAFSWLEDLTSLREQGTELPYQVATSSGATSIQFRKANLKLQVKPQITPEGSVIMTLDINKDSVGQATTQGFAIDTKHVKTEVLVENGGTVVIGGIYTQEERINVSRVPFFGDLPYIGFLFKNTERRDNKNELLVFITPKVVTDALTLR